MACDNPAQPGRQGEMTWPLLEGRSGLPTPDHRLARTGCLAPAPGRLPWFPQEQRCYWGGDEHARATDGPRPLARAGLPRGPFVRRGLGVVSLAPRAGDLVS